MRETPRPRRTGRIAITVATAALALGCASKDTPTAPAGNPLITPISVTNAWAHANGQSFAYRYVVRTGPTPTPQLFPTAGSVPAVSLEFVAGLLAAPPPFTVLSETTNGYVLTFQDSAMTTSGVSGQNLVSAVTSWPIPNPLEPALGVTGPGPAPPLLLRGGVWRQEATRIGSFDNSGIEPTWVYLEGALADRTSWQAQLVPGLAIDVLMRARAYETVSVDIAGYRRDDALDVHYLVDYGVRIVNDNSGNFLGYTRGFSYGRVIWLEGVGPMYLCERQGLSTGNTPSPPASESTLLLENVTFPVGF